MKDAVDWLERYRQHWEERLDRLEDYLKQLQATTPLKKTKPHGRRKKSSR